MRYEKYKEIDLPWLKEIPEHWGMRRIASVFEQRKEKNNPVKTKEILSLSAKYGVSLYSERKEKGGNKPKEDISNYNVCHQGDILVNCMNVVAGSVGLSHYYGAISPVYYALKIIDNQSNKTYMEYIFRNYYFQRSLVGTGKGIQMSETEDGKLYTVRMRISYDSFKVQQIPIPPLSEQEQIAKFLDWKINEIDRLIKIEKEKIVHITYLNKSIIHKNINEITEHEYISLKRVCAVIPGKEIIEEVDASNKNAVSVYGSGDQVFKYTDRYMLDGKYIIFGRKGTIGKPYIVKGKFWIVDTAYAMTNNGMSYFNYLYYLMVIFPWEDYSTNTVKPSIVASQMLTEKIKIPNIDRQFEIANRIDELLFKNNALIVKLRNYINELQNLKQSLISEVVTGKINVQNIEIPDYDKIKIDIEDDADDLEAEIEEGGE